MKYIRIVIIVLTLTLIGIGIYYVYLLLTNFGSGVSFDFGRKDNTETVIPLEYIQSTPTRAPKVANIFNYTSVDLATSGGIIKIQGRFQAVDYLQSTINGIAYTCVVGIKDENGDLSRVWLTADEYGQISDALSNWVKREYPVLLTLSQDGVSIVIESL